MKFVYCLGCSWQLRGWERLCEVLSMQISAKSAVLPFVLICMDGVVSVGRAVLGCGWVNDSE